MRDGTLDLGESPVINDAPADFEDNFNNSIIQKNSIIVSVG